MAVSKPGVITNWEAMEEQIIFYRSHLDIFIEDAFPPIRLTEEQHVMARAFGNCTDISYVQSRGSGKTWLVAICCHGIAVLYPGTPIVVTAPTAPQATLILEKLRLFAEQNPNVANELSANNARSLVQLSRDKGRATYKNGSKIESFAYSSLRGQRAKLVVIDEARDTDYKEMDAIVSPVQNYRRDISFNHHFKDFESKMVRISSACEKAKPFYTDFLRVVRDMAKGKQNSFACALDYKVPVRSGITSEDFFESERNKMPQNIFSMEYESNFLGSASNAAFPYELIQSCRTLKKVELEQPKNSKAHYVISLDIATSDADDADKSIISVLKFTERADGSYTRKMVYMRSFKGKTLDVLAEEIRTLYHKKFPNAERIIYDARGLGDSFSRFFDKEWVDVANNKEYPPLAVDDEPNRNPEAIVMLHPVRAVNSINQRLYTNMRVALEKRSIELPIPQRSLMMNEAEAGEDSKHATREEQAVYYETDALQIEMCNIVQTISKNGNVIYDTPNHRVHKDRYSSLAMGNDYISELEKANMKRFKNTVSCIGLATDF